MAWQKLFAYRAKKTNSKAKMTKDFLMKLIIQQSCPEKPIALSASFSDASWPEK